MYNASDEIELTKNLLMAMGVDIQKGSYNLIDQEDKTQLIFEGKAIKANNDPSQSLYISKYDIKLEPCNPKCTKLMERLFGRFIDKEVEIENIPEMQTYYFDKDVEIYKVKRTENEINKYKLNIKYADGTHWEGNWFYNKILCYVEAIFTIDGTFLGIDLRPFDDIDTGNNED